MESSPSRGRGVGGAMLDESRRIIDAARERGVVLRLIGGLAVREHGEAAGLGDREARDIDFVGRRRQVKGIMRTLADLGYEENRYVRLATGGGQMQFFRPCVHHGAGEAPAHEDDRVDVFLDTLRLEHEIPLKERLAVQEYAMPACDVLLVKLQRADLDEHDLRDILTLLAETRCTDHDGPGALNVGRIARECARDWGLHHDVVANLARVRALAVRAPLSPSRRDAAGAALDELEAAIEHQHKGLRWRLRALFGERIPWRDMVDERDGRRIGLREGPPRDAP